MAGSGGGEDSNIGMQSCTKQTTLHVPDSQSPVCKLCLWHLSCERYMFERRDILPITVRVLMICHTPDCLLWNKLPKLGDFSAHRVSDRSLLPFTRLLT
jgi:hypothetical protein